MGTLNAKQRAALEAVMAAGTCGFENWDSKAKRRPIHAATMHRLDALGLVSFECPADGASVYRLTDAGRAALDAL